MGDILKILMYSVNIGETVYTTSTLIKGIGVSPQSAHFVGKMS